ncbi:aldose epimerase family protein [Sphingomonas montana]|uniref:aldose epimerase family protein n=1 Tax=Sphingomonas montana TaxID=1843236 RepID=UPI00101AD712|nr:aldose epimerase family protein [Sphingomonas montana]
MVDVERMPTRLKDGREIAVFRLSARDGIAVTVAELGATLMGIEAPDRDGRMANIVLGLPDIAAYPSAGAPGADVCLGGSCGRFANRIGGACLELDGRTVRLVANEGRNHLHGGPDGFHRRIWKGERLSDGVAMTIDSPDGDQGWPGRLKAIVEFRLIGSDTVSITYQATTDRPTFVNLVSHGYFNLDGAGCGDVRQHELLIASDRFLAIDTAALPTGEVRDVAGTAFDFRSRRAIGDAMRLPDVQLRPGRGYNHCYILPGDGLRPAASLRSPRSGRTMELATDQAGLQFYDGYALGRGGSPFADRAGLCLEAQGWPDSPNHAAFPSARLDPGETYLSQLRLRFGTRD